MTDKLQEVRDAFEDALRANDYASDSVSFYINKAWDAFNSYIEARDGEEMVERVAKAIQSTPMRASFNIAVSETQLLENARDLARAAMKAMEGGE
jgi:hypothetical protein